ncbi:chromate resistance protein ChrB domain-containing protein [Chitinophaga polysaccharea]|uniref:chromate resistance protein ChrB domain-containing protein n=1 Tax=Chitinophaga polysaccharea TaxID=1293035 RepID=UPI001FFC6874|nr:chromate resistance protein ChrB domain-containing protein [Chitinophaga polysaccharea]
MMKWITRERPKIDRIACPWLISRFIDPDAEIIYAPANQVLEKAKEYDAIPFDIPGVAHSHEGEFCSFDYFLKRYELDDPALLQLAVIVRAADTNRFDLAPQAAGLWAISAGLSYNYNSDSEMLEIGRKIYDALYSWAKFRQSEQHTWTETRPQNEQ